MGDIPTILEFLPAETGVIDPKKQEAPSVTGQARAIYSDQRATPDLVEAVAEQSSFVRKEEEPEQED